MTLQQQIIKALGAKPQINAEEEIRRSVDFLKSYLQTYPFIKSLVLGISGGQDSTLAGKLCQMAINELRLETGNESLQFIAVRLPYGVQADEQDCQDAIAFIQPDRVLTVNIKGAVLASEQALREAGIELSDFVRGNEKARERMKAQYSIAGMTSGVVVGTDHAAEAITGFFTKYGDGGTDINPLYRLNKRQGKQLLAALACPEHLYKKAPTADLEDDQFMNIPNIYVHSLMTYPPDQGCICFMVKVTPCRSISAKALTSAAASFLIYVPRMKPPCYGNPDGSAGYVPPVKSALCSLKRD